MCVESNKKKKKEKKMRNLENYFRYFNTLNKKEKAKFFDHIRFLMAIQFARSHILKLKLRFSKCTVIMGRDHGHPYNRHV